MKARELAQRITSNSAPQVIDARNALEFKRGHIPVTIHAPVLKILLKRGRLAGNKNSELVITCEHGPCAITAACVLASYGYRNTSPLKGHRLGW